MIRNGFHRKLAIPQLRPIHRPTRRSPRAEQATGPGISHAYKNDMFQTEEDSPMPLHQNRTISTVPTSEHRTSLDFPKNLTALTATQRVEEARHTLTPHVMNTTYLTSTSQSSVGNSLTSFHPKKDHLRTHCRQQSQQRRFKLPLSLQLRPLEGQPPRKSLEDMERENETHTRGPPRVNKGASRQSYFPLTLRTTTSIYRV